MKKQISKTIKEAILRCYLDRCRPPMMMAIRAARFNLKRQGIAVAASDEALRRWLKAYCENAQHQTALQRA